MNVPLVGTPKASEEVDKDTQASGGLNQLKGKSQAMAA